MGTIGELRDPMYIGPRGEGVLAVPLQFALTTWAQQVELQSAEGFQACWADGLVWAKAPEKLYAMPPETQGGQPLNPY